MSFKVDKLCFFAFLRYSSGCRSPPLFWFFFTKKIKTEGLYNEKLSQEKAYRIMLKGYPDVLDIKQMCEILGISLKTGYGLIQENKIECLKVGRAYKIPKPFLLSYLRIGASSDSQ